MWVRGAGVQKVCSNLGFDGFHTHSSVGRVMDSYLRRLFIVPEGPSSQQLTCSIFLIGFLGCAREIELVRLGWEGMWQKQEKLWEGGNMQQLFWQCSASLCSFGMRLWLLWTETGLWLLCALLSPWYSTNQGQDVKALKCTYYTSNSFNQVSLFWEHLRMLERGTSFHLPEFIRKLIFWLFCQREKGCQYFWKRSTEPCMIASFNCFRFFFFLMKQFVENWKTCS